MKNKSFLVFLYAIAFYTTLTTVLPFAFSTGDKAPYFYPENHLYSEKYLPKTLSNSYSSYPLFFLIVADIPYNSVETTFFSLQTNAGRWALPHTFSPDKSQSLLVITNSDKDGLFKITQSWDKLLHEIQWDSETIKKCDTAYQIFLQKKSSLYSFSSSLKKLLYDYQQEYCSPRLIEIQRLSEKLYQPADALEDTLSEFFILADQIAPLALNDYPHLLRYRTAVCDNDSMKSLRFSDEDIEYQKEQFNNELINTTHLMTIDDSRFFIENIYADNITLETYNAMQKILVRLTIDFTGKYPSYNRFLYLLAWSRECRTPVFCKELADAFSTMENLLMPSSQNRFFNECRQLNQSVLNLLDDTLSYRDYVQLRSVGKILENRSESLSAEERKLFHNLQEILTERTLIQFAETLNAFSDFVSFYKTDALHINTMQIEQSIAYIYLFTHTKDIAAWHFWFSSFDYGSVLAIEPFNPKNKEENNYFELMRGHRSSFEKLLEGIKGDMQ
ncbi:hypothetical protein KDK77_01510 [bacterium]|nr:hypothetical protein [bacterium]MCP5462545.1 hypothetical protein [bacterium]